MFTQKHVDACLEEGFRKAFVKDGRLFAMFPGNGDEHDDEMIVDECEDGGYRAIVAVGHFGMKTPKTITKATDNGCSPVYWFKSVGEAAKLAMSGVFY
jgi:hypothetical protein